MVAIYHNDPEVTAADALRSDAGVVIPNGHAKPDGLGEIRLPAGRYARTTHVGPYELLGDAWSRFLGGCRPAVTGSARAAPSRSTATTPR
jgi:AraC family transcriptional regulator